MRHDFIVRNDIQQGEYDNVGIARYEVPGYWDVGKVFERLIEDASDEGDKVESMKRVSLCPEGGAQPGCRTVDRDYSRLWHAGSVYVHPNLS